MDFDLEDTRRLAKLERAMDAGEQEFVILNGERVAVSKATMERLMLKSGQTISNQLMIAILESHIQECQDKIKEHK